MTPAEKLKEIEELFRLNQEMYKRQGIKQPKSEVETYDWLITRVKRLTEALEGIIKKDEAIWEQYPQSKGVYSYYADEARKALEGDRMDDGDFHSKEAFDLESASLLPIVLEKLWGRKSD